MMRCLLLLILLTRLVLAPGGWADEPANQASPTAEEAAVLDQPEPADTPAAERNGMADLDEATTLKVTAEGAANSNQINQVIDLLDDYM